MKENEAKFLGELFTMIAKHNVSFGASQSEPTYIYVGDRQIAEIVGDDDGNTSININVTFE